MEPIYWKSHSKQLHGYKKFNLLATHPSSLFIASSPTLAEVPINALRFSRSFRKPPESLVYLTIPAQTSSSVPLRQCVQNQDFKLREIKMSVHTRFAIEYPSNAPHTSIPIPTLAQTAPSIPEEGTDIRTSFPSLWKGICDFAIGIFKSKTRRVLEEKNQILDEENKKLEERMQTLQEDNQRLGDNRKRLKEKVALVKVKIAEVSKMGERTEG